MKNTRRTKKKLMIFTERLRRGLYIEAKETVEIVPLIKKREYKKAGSQVVDIMKMGVLVAIWIMPGGSIVSAFILKTLKTARPSAFQKKERRAESVEDSK